MNPRKSLAHHLPNIATILIEMALSHEIVLQEKASGQQLDASNRVGLLLVYAKVTTATFVVLGTIAQR